MSIFETIGTLLFLGTIMHGVSAVVREIAKGILVKERDEGKAYDDRDIAICINKLIVSSVDVLTSNKAALLASICTFFGCIYANNGGEVAAVGYAFACFFIAGVLAPAGIKALKPQAQATTAPRAVNKQ